MRVILYTTGCPNCKLLEKLLTSKEIKHGIITDVDVMIKMGFQSSPQLEVDGLMMDYTHAKVWVNEYNG